MAPEPDDDRGGWWPEGEEPERADRPEREGAGGPQRPPRGLATPGASKPASRYSLFVGLAFVAIIVIALLNLLGNDDAGILGVSSGEPGLALAEFAAPDALGAGDGDANVFQDDCESSRNPCPASEQRSPACEIESAGALRVCDLFDKPLAISFWFTRGGDCLPSQDNFDATAARYRGRVNFLSVNVRDDRDKVAEIVRGRGWSVPVVLDPDGAVSNLYRVGGCPTIVLAFPGGVLDRAEIGGSAEEIDGYVADLLADTRARAAYRR